MTKSAIIIIGIALFGFVGFAVFGKKQVGQVGCTMEAKVCPDGSAVGRSGPSCEFAPCPTVPVANENIHVTSPLPDEVIKSPIRIRGEARGTWYFEGSFPLSVVGENGMMLGNGTAQAKGNWMTAEFVPFEATIDFTVPTTAAGSVVLSKDNPSGLSENAVRIMIPIRF